MLHRLKRLVSPREGVVDGHDAKSVRPSSSDFRGHRHMVSISGAPRKDDSGNLCADMRLHLGLTHPSRANSLQLLLDLIAHQCVFCAVIIPRVPPKMGSLERNMRALTATSTVFWRRRSMTSSKTKAPGLSKDSMSCQYSRSGSAGWKNVSNCTSGSALSSKAEM